MPGDGRREKAGRAVDDAFDLTRRSRSSRRNLLWIVGVVAVVFLLSEAGLFGDRRDGVPLVEIDPDRVDRLLAGAPILPTIGDAGQAGGVRVVEFFDYACGHCRRMAFAVDEAVASGEGFHVAMVEYPVLGPESELAARYALAAELQGGYGPYHRALMFSAVAYTDESLTLLGNGLGLDADRLRVDARGETVDAALAANRGIAAELGIEGVPAFAVGDLLFVGAIDAGSLLGLVASRRDARRPRLPTRRSTAPSRAGAARRTRRSAPPGPSLRRFLAVLLVPIAMAARADESSPGPTRDEIETIVREYLIENPDVVIEALREHERRTVERLAAEAQRALIERADEIFRDPETPVGGDPDGAIAIVEFFDYRCGYCRSSAPDLFALRDEVEGVKVIYKEFPILGDASDRAARAALAARNQGLYEPFHEALMTADIGFGEDEIMAVAAEIGLDVEVLGRDMNDPAIRAYLDRTRDLAFALGVEGTPAFIVNGTLYTGALSRSDFDRLLAAGDG